MLEISPYANLDPQSPDQFTIGLKIIEAVKDLLKSKIGQPIVSRLKFLTPLQHHNVIFEKSNFNDRMELKLRKTNFKTLDKEYENLVKDHLHLGINIKTKRKKNNIRKGAFVAFCGKLLEKHVKNIGDYPNLEETIDLMINGYKNNEEINKNKFNSCIDKLESIILNNRG